MAPPAGPWPGADAHRDVAGDPGRGHGAPRLAAGLLDLPDAPQPDSRPARSRTRHPVSYIPRMARGDFTAIMPGRVHEGREVAWPPAEAASSLPGERPQCTGAPLALKPPCRVKKSWAGCP